jgi:glycosyltransferase involved in cell wall biosynthesis
VRILHVTPFYEPYWAYGGMARASAGLCRALAARGHEVTVATALLAPGPPAEETLGGVRVQRFPGPAILDRVLFPLGRGLTSFLRGTLGAIDVAHLHGHRNGLAVTAARALRSAGRPWVLQPSGTFPHHGQFSVVKAVFDRAAGDAIVRHASALVAVSEAEARDLPRSSRVVPNGVEPCGTPPRAPLRTGRRILFVGTDRPQKRGHVLPALLDALPGTELQLVGRFGPEFLRRFDAFPSRMTASGVLAGDALAAAYAAADLLVHPAVGEAFGLVPFEAACAGTASVVAGGHGCGEWYARAGGCVTPPDDLVALVRAVKARLDDPALGAHEAESVAVFARERLTWDAAAAGMEAVYRDAVGARV